MKRLCANVPESPVPFDRAKLPDTYNIKFGSNLLLPEIIPFVQSHTLDTVNISCNKIAFHLL